ncbi:hypothetical protein IJ103_03045 [Candidatus Saccharibacteria bacterium]|nr:hypothetical protein [Candidatus Saccharibacteria bacterium]
MGKTKLTSEEVKQILLLMNIKQTIFSIILSSISAVIAFLIAGAAEKLTTNITMIIIILIIAFIIARSTLWIVLGRIYIAISDFYNFYIADRKNDA